MLKDSEAKKIPNNFKLKIPKPKVTGNQKYPRKVRGVVMGWEKILSLKRDNCVKDEYKMDLIQTENWLDRVDNLMR